MQFKKILNKTLKWEGGFVNDQFDRGGATKYGITLTTLKAINEDVDDDGKIDINDIEELTPEDAEAIYKKIYYLKPRIHLLPEIVQPVVFDMGVNHGPARAIRILQRVINKAGISTITADGKIGPVTVNAADKAYAQMGHYFINAICDERQSFYNAIVSRDPSQKRFLRGWTNRNNDFRVQG